MIRRASRQLSIPGVQPRRRELSLAQTAALAAAMSELVRREITLIEFEQRRAEIVTRRAAGEAAAAW